MIFNDVIFQAICFFSLGFLCLIGFISLCLNYYFKSRAYDYYLLYIISTTLFVISKYIINVDYFDEVIFFKPFFTLLYEILKIVIFPFHTLFIYKSMVSLDFKFKKFDWLIKLYFVIVLIRVFTAIKYPDLTQNNHAYSLIYRTLAFGISFVFYYYLYLNIAKNYFKFLFIASTILIIVVFLSILDATINKNNNTFTGIVLIFTGIILDNLCFVAAFTYQIITIDREKKMAEIAHQEQLTTVQLEMQQQTMQHIGREIHDNVGQKLTLASLYTQQLAYENKAPLIKNTIENISDIINQSLKDLRQLSKSLTDNTIKINTLYNLLTAECEKFYELNNCEIKLESNSKNLILPYQSKSVLLRISQEFIQNSIKHSSCKNINISLNNSNNSLQLCLLDDGKGFDVNKKHTGIGLRNIKKRIEIIGGTYVLESQQNKGTKLLINLPL